MMSAGVIKSSESAPRARYYTQEYAGRAAETAEYYLDGGAEHARWHGDGAEELGLEGTVTEEQLLAVLQGRDPGTGQSLFDPTGNQLAGIARRLGIDRDLGADDIAALRRGEHPQTGRPLEGALAQYVAGLMTGRGGPARTVGAVDLTFSAPKSVSLMVATGHPQIRQVALDAHERAVEKALTFLRDHVLAVRRGHEGGEIQRAHRMTAALVTQLASRLHDPQLHTHTILSTAAAGEDGRVSAIATGLVMAASKVIGSVYQQQLRHELTAGLGVAWEVQDNGLGEIAGVPRDLLALFSKRSRQIAESLHDIQRAEDLLMREVELRRDQFARARLRVRLAPETATDLDRDRARKLDKYEAVLRERATCTGAPAGRRDLVAYLSRSRKDEPSERELRQAWEKEFAGTGHRWQTLLRAAQRTRAQQLRDEEETFEQRLAAALTRQQSVFGRKEALIAGARVADPAWDSDTVIARVDAWLAREAVQLREDRAQFGAWAVGGGARWTTEEVLAQERAMKATAQRMLDRDDVAVLPLEETAAKAREFTLDPEQEELLAALCLSGSQLVMARGIAGSGKTHVLGAAAELLRAQGHQVVGLATAAATAQRLASESGFDRASSIDRFLTLAAAGRWERGASPHLLADRQILLTERRRILREYGARLAAVAEGDEQAEEQILTEQDTAMADWQARWDAWLEAAEAETLRRERAAADIELDRQALDQTEEELDRRRAETEAMPDGPERDQARRDLQARRRQLHLARQAWSDRVEEYRRDLSPTVELPDDDRVVLVVDEAGMVEQNHYHELLALADERGWKIAFVGDDRQLQEVNRGGAFRMLAELGGSVEMTESRRSRHAWERAAQRRWWASQDPGTLREVAAEYAERGRVTWVDRQRVNTAIAAGAMEPDEVDDVVRETARQIMAGKWLADFDDGREAIMMAMRRDDVRALNHHVQQAMARRGIIDPAAGSVTARELRNGRAAGEYHLHAGDRIAIMSNVPGTPVKNGMSGTVTELLDDGGIRAELPTGPDGRTRVHTLPRDLLESGHVALGYAVTAHKAQGVSVERGYLLGESRMSREQLYPGLTRGKDHNEVIWMVEEDTAAEPLDQLAGAMTRSTRKLAALEVMRAQITPADVAAERRAWAARGIDLTDEEARKAVEERNRRHWLADQTAACRRDTRQDHAADRLRTTTHTAAHTHAHTRTHEH
ncbi:MobF family relaxase [Bailinhaonella thermotolerans]|uniref:TrwC relaxase domain-containing protein n=1 Tax=Bailinhaonella thermotolerans TaxID=1070861 RepID=A0A3A4APJ1_9ACTN|nr:MobF family relaxase [Bailinhaonella thermotolerans]RJL21259.1 hypothetical protein D5H75_37980 [Bailinhaonella thermotolerans]